MTEKRVTLSLDRDMYWDKPVFQLSLNVLDEQDRGHGYRLMGPKYLGNSKPVTTKTLSQRDADEIRAILDEVFPRDSEGEDAARRGNEALQRLAGGDPTP